MFPTVPRSGTPQSAAADLRPEPLLLSSAGAALFALAQLADLLTFLVMIARHGSGAELNPVALVFLDAGHLGLLVAVKIAAWALTLACAAVLARRTPRLAAFVVLFGIAAGLLGAFSNLLTL
jgi:hypothetical protein